jgi:ketosteroid isomerase-like protein
MRRISLAACALALSAACASGRAALTPPAGASATAHVQAAHAQWFEGILQENVAALDTLLANDMTFHDPGGGQGAKAGYLTVLRSGQLKYDSVSAEPATARLRGSVALVTGRVDIRYRWEESSRLEKLTYTAVYEWSGRGWRLLAWQSTFRPDSPFKG